MAVKTSKNDPTQRGAAATSKTLDGKKVKPVLYVGSWVGHGRYIAAQDESGKLTTDQKGKPISYTSI